MRESRRGGLENWRPRPESNRGARICSPLRNHSATRPRASVRAGHSIGWRTSGVKRHLCRFAMLVHIPIEQRCDREGKAPCPDRLPERSPQPAMIPAVAQRRTGSANGPELLIPIRQGNTSHPPRRAPRESPHHGPGHRLRESACLASWNCRTGRGLPPPGIASVRRSRFRTENRFPLFLEPLLVSNLPGA